MTADDRSELLLDEVRQGFDGLIGDIREMRSEMNARFDATQRTMVIGFVALGGGLVVSTAATVLAAVLG